MGQLIVITGPPGVGKSTVAPLVSARYPRSALVAGDEFFGFLDQGSIAPWLAGSEGQNNTVVEAAALAAGRFARGGFDVVYDGVIGPWFVTRFARAAQVERLHYVVLMRPLEQCQVGVRTRVDHGFTDVDATAEMYRQFADSASPPHRLDAGGAAEDIASEIVRLVAAGRLIVRPS